ncbi:MAG: DUF2911 domain-containing protein [Cyclobacteriaceae bacterium]|nr:DUF2911 domain-containing protein [Cyclobacteriaceae bacterium]
MAQEALNPRPSPMYLTTMKYDDTYIKITYGRPHKKDREIFGDLVPYGEVWRTGANEATELTATGDIMVAGNLVKQGTYSLFTIPQEDKWTIILNSALGQWGAYDYDKQKDVVRFEVPVETMEKTYEPFTIEFNQDNSDAFLLMMWDRTKVSIPVSFP